MGVDRMIGGQKAHNLLTIHLSRPDYLRSSLSLSNEDSVTTTINEGNHKVRSKNQWHMMEECHHLRNKIEKLIHHGYLTEFV